MKRPLKAGDQQESIEEDPNEEERKMLHRKMQWHTWRLWIAHAIFGFIMFVVAICSDDKYGFTYFYSNRLVGLRLSDLQYLWGIGTLLSAGFGFYIYRQWHEKSWDRINLKHAYKNTRRYIYLTGLGLMISSWGTVVLFVSFNGLKIGAGYSSSLQLYQILGLICFMLGGFYIFLRFLSLRIYTKKLKNWADWNGAWGDEEHSNRIVPLEEKNFTSLGDLENNGDDKVEVEDQLPNAPPNSDITNPSAEKSVAKDSSPVEMTPVLFEKHWTDLPTSGNFDCQIEETVPQDVINAHLVGKGFQIVASGTVRGEMKTYLACEKDTRDSNGRVWFIAQLIVTDSSLSATFKCQDGALVRECVQNLHLNEIFKLKDS